MSTILPSSHSILKLLISSHDAYTGLIVAFSDSISPSSIEDLANQIDAIANKGEVSQQAVLCIAERCWVLVNSYMEWRRKHEESLGPPSTSLPQREQLRLWIAKTTIQAEIELAYEALARFVLDPIPFHFTLLYSPNSSDLEYVVSYIQRKQVREAWDVVVADRVYVSVMLTLSFLTLKDFYLNM